MQDRTTDTASTTTSGSAEIDSIECPACGYDLQGLSEDRCPECGESFDRAFLSVYQREARHGALLGHRVGITIVSTFIAIGTGLAAMSLLREVGPFKPSVVLALLAVGAGAAGQAGLALLAFASFDAWPIRNDGARRHLIVLAIVSIALAGAAAGLGAIESPPSLRMGAMEWVLRGVLFALPGLSLLLLAVIAFHDRGAIASRARRGLEGGHGLDEPPPFEVAAFGRWKYGQLTTEWVDEPRAAHPVLDASIDKIWEQQLAEAAVSGRMLYNGQMGRLVGFEASRERLHLVVGPTCYRDFVGTNLFNAEAVRALGDEYLADPVGISNTAITSDGYILYGRRNDKVAYHPGYLHTFGGALEAPDRVASGGYDPFLAAMRELCEELVVVPEEVADLRCIGIVRDTTLGQPEVLFDATLKLTRDEVLARFDPQAEHQEHRAIEWLFDTPDEVVPFLSGAGMIAPILEGALMLHGRLNWGEDWYELACMLRYGGLPREGD